MFLKKSKSLAAAWVSLISNVALTVLKLGVGIAFRSQVLLADGVHNAGDVIASAAALSAMRISNRPADEDHPYGHGKAEVVSSAIVAIILAIAALYIAYHSVLVLMDTAHPASWIALIAAAVSLFWKQALYIYTIRVGQASRSKGLIATAKDHLADVYASLAAVIGIGLGLVGNYYDIPWLSYGDPVAGIIVSIFVMKLAVLMGREAIDILMEKTVGGETLQEFADLIRSIPEVKRIDRLRAREHGHYILVDLRVAVSGRMTIQEGHDIGSHIKEKIKTAHPEVDEVLVHLNPWYEQPAQVNKDTKKPLR